MVHVGKHDKSPLQPRSFYSQHLKSICSPQAARLLPSSENSPSIRKGILLTGIGQGLLPCYKSTLQTLMHGLVVRRRKPKERGLHQAKVTPRQRKRKFGQLQSSGRFQGFAMIRRGLHLVSDHVTASRILATRTKYMYGLYTSIVYKAVVSGSWATRLCL